MLKSIWLIFIDYMYMLYKQVCNKHGDKSNQWSLGLTVRQH